ncbi:MAG TPA: 4-hydroxy-tetrahydrodipicolinate synthase [Bacillota bacterium]|nr:4-hydroxy-tetrahydrodipicolinate synthase [Bacillota bacterium]
MNFGNVVTAMVTPFKDNGMVDYLQTKILIEHLIHNGSDGIVVAGTTGESPTLSAEEKIELFTFAVKQVDGRIPIIAGTGSNNTAASIALTKEVEKLGVDAIMLVVPYYNRPSQAGMIAHFEAIATSTSLPIMLYNIPGRSSAQLDVETVVQLSQIPNIVSLKDASANLIYMSYVRAQTSEGFSLYCGDDGLTLPSLSVGATGVVSVASHIIGPEMQEMVRAFKDGDMMKAENLHHTLLPVMEAMFAVPSPAPVKAALEMKDLPVGSVRLPLLPLTSEERATLSSVIR